MGALPVPNFNPQNYPNSFSYDPLQSNTEAFLNAPARSENRFTHVRESDRGSPSYQSSVGQMASSRTFRFKWAGGGDRVAHQVIRDFRGYSVERTLAQDDIGNTPIAITGSSIVESGTGLKPNRVRFTAANSFIAGEGIVLSGFVPSDWDGAYTVYAATGTTFDIWTSIDYPNPLAIPPIVATAPNLAAATVKRHPNYISRILPATNPSLAGLLWCSGLSIEPEVPFGKDTDGVGLSDEGLVHANYSNRLYRLLFDQQMKTITGGIAPDESTLLRYCQMIQDTQAKFQTLPALAYLRYDEDNAPVEQKAYIILAEGDLTVTWIEVPYRSIPRTAIAKCLGKANSYDFGHSGSFFGAFPQGTLVMLVPRFSPPAQMSNGEWAVDITYRFKYYPFGANAIYRMPIGTAGNLTPRFSFISTNLRPSGRPFRQFDFNTLFRPEPV